MHRLAIPVRKRVEVDRRCKDNNKGSSSSNHTTMDNNITSNNDNNDNNGNNNNNNNDDIHKRKQQKRLKVPVNDDDDDDDVMIIKDNENDISKTNQVQDNDIRTDKKRTLDEIVLIEDNDVNIVINSVKATTTTTVNSNNHIGKRQSNDNNDHIESMRVLLGRSNDSSSKSNDKKKHKDLPAVTCMVCGVTIDHMDQSKREAHVNKCLDKEQGIAKKKTKSNNNDAIYINSDDDDDVFIKLKSTSKDHAKKGNVKQTKLVRSEKGTLKVIDDPITSKDDAIMKNMTADEQELYTLRLQLGELSNKEAEIRSKKIQITKNIKRITRKVNQASDFKLVNQENTDINEVLNILFPQVNTSVSVNSNSNNNNACPLWMLAQQHSAFDEVAAGKRINENSYMKIEKNEKAPETMDDNENNDDNSNENGINNDNDNNENSNEKSILSQFNDMLQHDDIDNNDKAINALKALIKEEIVTSLDSNKSVDDWLQEASRINALDIILEFLCYEGSIDTKEIELHLFHSISAPNMITNVNRCIHMIECLLQEIVNSSSSNDRQTYVFIAQFLLYYISVNMKQGKQGSATAIDEGPHTTDSTTDPTITGPITDPPITTNTIEAPNTEIDTHLDTNDDHYDDGFYVLDNNDNDTNDHKVNSSHDSNNVNDIIHSAGPRSDSSFNSQYVNLSAANTFNDDDNLHDDFYGDDDSIYDNDPKQNECTQKETETIYISDDEPVVEPLATRLKVTNSKKTIPTDNVLNTTQVDLDLKRILYSEVEPDFESLSIDQIQLIAKNVGLKAQSRYILIPLLQNMYQRIHNPSTQCAIASSQVISSQPASQVMSSHTASQMNVGNIDLVAYFKQNDNMDLYEKIVNLIPIDVDEVHNRMKMQGYNISKDKMKALLDAGNIFFTYGKNK